MLALAMGRLDEAEELVSEGFAWGQRAVPHGATSVYHLQRYTLRDFRGGVGEMEATIRALIAEYPARVVFRCVLAHLHSRSGRRPEATRALEELAEDGFGALPFDQEWLLGTSYLAETAAFLEDADSAAVLYRSLLPWSALVAVDVGEGFRGSVARYLGLLATTMGRWDDSEEHFEAALELNDRMGARPWLARTQEDYGRMLLARDAPGDPERAQDLFDAARRTYRELGMEPGL
jgi:tetratricopeptide (TPR) repeat protein